VRAGAAEGDEAVVDAAEEDGVVGDVAGEGAGGWELRRSVRRRRSLVPPELLSFHP
jgi:hypothetical protein